MTIEDTPPPPASADRVRVRRRTAAAIAAAVVTLGLLGAVLAASLHPAHLEWYRADGQALEVEVCRGSGEAVAWSRVTETGEQIVVDIELFTTMPPGLPRNAMATCDLVRLELDAAVDGRTVVTPEGTALRALP
ncbi:hypothetical protein [Demequina sp. NBRC 110053]|uniref:hypothetical protein n=1 Tax=Demequina sp. NBRC 110053 TaxID=1570342 RepID=UPI0009FF114F|nr:hypothetical protein [Demequina sp. NBRC 110053]